MGNGSGTRWPWLWTAGVIAATLVGFGLCLYQIDAKSIWIDEGSSVSFAKMSWATLWRAIANEEGALGFYYVILKLWLTLGDSELMLRLPSAIFATLSIPFVYAIGARVWSHGAGLGAAVLLATNAFFVRYGQEARPYALALFLVVVATYVFVRANEKNSWAWWATYAVAGALAAYAHLHSSFVIAGHATTLFLLPDVRARLPRAVTAYIAMLALLIPMALFVITGDKGQIDWLPEPTAPLVEGAFLKLSGSLGWGLAALYAIGLVACLSLGLFVLIRSGRSVRSWAPIMVITAFAFVFGGSLIVSTYKPIFYPRYLIVALPAMTLACGIVVSSLRRWWLVVPVLGLLVTLAWPAIPAYYEEDGLSWPEIVGIVGENSLPEDAAIFIEPTSRRPFEYYVERSGGNDWPHAVYPAGEWGTYPLTLRPFRMEAEPLSAEAAQRDRVWLVARLPRDPVTQRFRIALESRCGAPRVWLKGRVRLFDC